MPEDIRRVFVCAHDISPEYHIRMQAAFQRHTDNAVSKTVNFPHSATREEVAEVYMLAYKRGLQGRDHLPRRQPRRQVLNIGKVNDKKAKRGREPELARSPLGPASAAPAPRRHHGLYREGPHRLRQPLHHRQLRRKRHLRGLHQHRQGRAAARARARPRRGWSVALRSGIDVDSRSIDQLKGIRCPSTIRQQGMSCTSCPDAIAKRGRKSRQVHQDSDGSKPALPAPEAHPGAPRKKAGSRLSLHAHFCPECGSKLEHEGGCVICRNCGYSKCGYVVIQCRQTGSSGAA
jgi:ribonucleoside-diphosphate reductase alpha chain